MRATIPCPSSESSNSWKYDAIWTSAPSDVSDGQKLRWQLPCGEKNFLESPACNRDTFCELCVSRGLGTLCFFLVQEGSVQARETGRRGAGLARQGRIGSPVLLGIIFVQAAQRGNTLLLCAKRQYFASLRSSHDIFVRTYCGVCDN